VEPCTRRQWVLHSSAIATIDWYIHHLNQWISPKYEDVVQEVSQRPNLIQILADGNCATGEQRDYARKSERERYGTAQVLHEFFGCVLETPSHHFQGQIKSAEIRRAIRVYSLQQARTRGYNVFKIITIRAVVQ